MDKRTESFEDILAEDLQDDEYAIGYLNKSLQSGEPRQFLLAIRRIAKARKIPMSQLSEELHLNRRGLYHALSEKGNPGWNTLHALLSALGFEIQITTKKSA